MDYPNFDPVAFQLGPLPIRWYALAYIAGIFAGWGYLVMLLKRPALWSADKKAAPPLSRTQLDDIVFWVTLGVILGGRLGYVLFYEPVLLIRPWESFTSMFGLTGILKTLFGWIHLPPALMLWRGGMSFHGGLIGVTLVGFFFSRRNNLPALRIGDLFACAAPLGLFFGRIANFINGELWGRPTDASWAMVFPGDPLRAPRHPSQLYEAFLEGVVLFAVVALLTWKFRLLRKPGAAIGVFLAGYGLSRIIVENFREPDAHMPDFPLGLTMGMMLSAPMVALGAWLVWRAYKGPDAPSSPAPKEDGAQSPKSAA